jgi:hypothetical protein
MTFFSYLALAYILVGFTFTCLVFNNEEFVQDIDSDAEAEGKTRFQVRFAYAVLATLFWLLILAWRDEEES